MYADTVIADKLVHKPHFILGLLVVAGVLFFLFNITESFLGHILSPVIGDPASSGLYGRFVVALLSLCCRFYGGIIAGCQYRHHRLFPS